MYMEDFVGFASYIVSFCVTTMLVVYVFKLPEKITGATKLVHQYYYEDSVKHFFLDIVLVYLYLSAANVISRRSFESPGPYTNVFVVATTTAAISTAFMFYFLRQKPGSSFFASWFHKVGFKAVAYDVILVSLVYLASEYIVKPLCI